MGLMDINSRQAVLSAVAEYDRLGQPDFLKKYGFGRAREYLLIVDGREYDSKAIVGAAHGYQFPQDGPLRAGKFNGGAATVQRLLESHGFEVRVARPSGSEPALPFTCHHAQKRSSPVGPLRSCVAILSFAPSLLRGARQ